LHIVQLVNSLQFGGAEQVVVSLSSALRALGHEVLVVCLRRSDGPTIGASTLARASVPVISLDKPSGIHLPSLKHLVEILRREGTEVVNTHNHLVHHYGVAGARVTGAVVVNTLHGTDTLNMGLGARVLYWASCIAGHGVVAVGGAVRRELLRRYLLPADLVVVQENGIPQERFLAVPPRQRHEATIFGTVGRLVPVKDHTNLLTAFATLYRHHPGCRLRLLGSGPLETDLAALAGRLGIAGAVEFHGFSNTPEDFLAGLDVFVLSSRSEGLPISLLEAMASGLPIVATAVGSIPEVVTPEFAWLCPPRDSAQLAQAMEKSLAADLPRAGESARCRAREKYDSLVMARGYEALYGSLLADHQVK